MVSKNEDGSANCLPAESPTLMPVRNVCTGMYIGWKLPAITPAKSKPAKKSLSRIFWQSSYPNRLQNRTRQRGVEISIGCSAMSSFNSNHRSSSSTHTSAFPLNKFPIICRA